MSPADQSPDRLELAVASLGVLAVGAPFLWGDGVDFPDDAVYHALPTWEWLRSAWLSGESIWFVPGKLGGVSLMADSVAMGPLYPAAWLLWLLPAGLALALAMIAHSLGTLFAVRWMARTMGVSARSATLAGAGVALGTTGVFGFVDCQADTWPLFLWFPVVVGALERLDQASDRSGRTRWAAVAGAALGLLLLGTHLRWAAATGASLGLWVLLRRPRLGWTAAALALGLTAGLPGYLPKLLELSQSALSLSRTTALSYPAHTWLEVWNLSGFLAPKPIHLFGDHSAGAILGLAFVVGLGSLKGTPRRLGILALILFAAPFSTQVPGLRWAFAPLLLLSHPVNHFYPALAMIPAAAAGGAALDQLQGERAGAFRRRMRGPAGLVLALLGLVLAARVIDFPGQVFRSHLEWKLHLLAALQFGGVLALLGLLLRRQRSPGPGRHRAIVLLGLADLLLCALRLHTALPATAIDWQERDAMDVTALEPGFLHLTELADLEAFDYEPASPAGVVSEIEAQSEEIRQKAQDLQVELLDRRWPVHLGLARGLRSATGIAKLPPRRSVELLEPLAEALLLDPSQRTRLEDHQPEGLAPLFDGPQSLGNRTMSLFGTPVAVGPGDMRFLASTVAPPCYSPGATRVVSDSGERVAQVLDGRFRSDRLALLESPVKGLSSFPASARVQCSDSRRVEVSADSLSLVVLRERHHPGWQVTDDSGLEYPTLAVNQVHLGVVVPAGDRVLRAEFVPPGLRPSLLAAGLAWLLLASGGFLPGRRS